MKDNIYFNQSNLTRSEGTGVNKDIRDLFEIGFTTYKISENYKLIYKNDPNCTIPKRLIELYIKYINPDYNSMIYSFKNRYISNEVLVEKNDTKEQRRGLSNVYDFIQNFDVNEDKLDIFTTTLRLNYLLWEPTDKKNNMDSELEKEKIKERVAILKKEAKEEKNLAKYREATKLESELSSISHKSKIGGQLRSNNYEDDVDLLGTGIKVPSAKESLKYMNSYLSNEKKKEFVDALNNKDIISYIGYCVQEIATLIYYQPFMDGNKRTFRALLNLMFKVKGLPPVYVKSSERNAYKDALFKAIKDGDYQELIGFYLFKICDSIYELDVVPYKNGYNNIDDKNIKK